MLEAVKTDLEIYFGHHDNEIYGVEMYFKLSHCADWFNNEIAIEMLKDICHLESINGEALTVLWFGEGPLRTIAPDDLPGGVKALLLMLNTDEMVQASRCGDNCAKWIIEIAKYKKLRISLNSLMPFRVDFDALVLNDGSYIHSYKDYLMKSNEWLDRVYERKYRAMGWIK